MRVTVGDLVQLGEVLSGGSYLLQSSLRLHLGLGGHETIDQIEVLWPEGRKETLNYLAAYRFNLASGRQEVISSKVPEHSMNLP